MPGQRAEGTILANFSVDKALWQLAISKAKSEGRSLSDVLREFLRGYVGA